MKKDKRDLEATKTALLNAAEKLMEGCTDPNDVTSRAITREAGVNLAMINYCFGSREALLFEVVKKLKRRAFGHDPAVAKLLAEDISPKEKLTRIHVESVKLLLKNHKYAKAVIRYALLERDLNDDRISARFIYEHFGGEKTEGECKLIAHEISALNELLVLRHKDIIKTCGIDLFDDETLKRIVAENISRFLDYGNITG